MQSFQTSITDPETLHNIKFVNGLCFSSRIFCMHGLKWFLKILNKDGTIQFYIYLISLPSKVKSITIFRKQSFQEGQIHYENQYKFDAKSMSWGWSDSQAKQSATNIQKYSKLTFKLESELLGVEDIDGN
eukprot:341383_1